MMWVDLAFKPDQHFRITFSLGPSIINQSCSLGDAEIDLVTKTDKNRLKLMFEASLTLKTAKITFKDWSFLFTTYEGKHYQNCETKSKFGPYACMFTKIWSSTWSKMLHNSNAGLQETREISFFEPFKFSKMLWKVYS